MQPVLDTCTLLAWVGSGIQPIAASTAMQGDCITVQYRCGCLFVLGYCSDNAPLTSSPEALRACSLKHKHLSLPATAAVSRDVGLHQSMHVLPDRRSEVMACTVACKASITSSHTSNFLLGCCSEITPFPPSPEALCSCPCLPLLQSRAEF